MIDRKATDIFMNMSLALDRVNNFLLGQVAPTIKQLLEERFLYQNLKIDESLCRKNFEEELKDSDFATSYLHQIEKFTNASLGFGFENEKASGGFILHRAHPPATVNTQCEVCKCITPHNPESYDVFGGRVSTGGYDESIVLQLKCQKCKDGIIVAAIRRIGLKFQLVGRNQIDKYTPKYNCSYLSDEETILGRFAESMMAERTGSHLAAICLLRIAVEQYMRSVANVHGVRLTGDELAEKFDQCLSQDFPRGKVVNLKTVYDRLSEIIHEPSEYKDQEFEKVYADVVKFLNLVQILPPEKLSTSTHS